MRTFMFSAALTAALLAVSSYSPLASAKGCLKGAAVGGVAGHVAGGHGVIGAAAGCAIEHHRETKAAKAAASQPAAPAAPASPSAQPAPPR